MLIITPFAIVFIVNFEQVNAVWVQATLIDFLAQITAEQK